MADLFHRVSIRKYQEKKVEPEKLDYILRASMAAPSACNQQPWEFYIVEDPEILSAITWHTTGKEDMTLLEKIIYIADYIEPARNKAPHLTRLRKLAFTDIDECMYEILKDSMAYLSENPKTMDPMTEQAYQFYEALHRERTAKEEA